MSIAEVVTNSPWPRPRNSSRQPPAKRFQIGVSVVWIRFIRRSGAARCSQNISFPEGFNTLHYASNWPPAQMTVVKRAAMGETGDDVGI